MAKKEDRDYDRGKVAGREGTGKDPGWFGFGKNDDFNAGYDVGKSEREMLEKAIKSKK